MYNNPYMRPYNNAPQQGLYEQIDYEINNLQQMKERMKNNATQVPTNLTQNFQISPLNRETIKYVSSIDEVQKENVIGDTPYFSKDMSIMWLKNAKGEIKSYELKEVVLQDEKDLLISSLQMQIEELRKEVRENAKSDDTNVDEPTSIEESASVQPNKPNKRK